jgi:ankyrin repeat protein
MLSQSFSIYLHMLLCRCDLIVQFCECIYLQMIVYMPPLAGVTLSETKAPPAIDDLGDEGLNLVRRGDLQAVKALMARSGWDPHTSLDKHGNTCLTWAAGEGHLDMCRFFVTDCGMNPLVRTGARKRQRQALHWAARNGHIDICAWLIGEHGADVDVGTDDGSTPLHLAIWNHQPETVKWLVEKSHSDVNRKNSHGCNASQWAALSGDISMLEYLKEKGLDLAILNANGRSAVHKAGLKGHLAACQWLLAARSEGGAGLSLRHVGPDVEGDTPASLAKSNGHSAVEQWLLGEQSRLQLLEGEGGGGGGGSKLDKEEE